MQSPRATGSTATETRCFCSSGLGGWNVSSVHSAATHPQAPVFGDDCPEAIRPTVLLLQRPAQYASCTVPIFRRAPFPTAVVHGRAGFETMHSQHVEGEIHDCRRGGKEEPAAPVVGRDDELPLGRSEFVFELAQAEQPHWLRAPDRAPPRNRCRGRRGAATRAASMRVCNSEADRGGGAITWAISSCDSNASNVAASRVSPPRAKPTPGPLEHGRQPAPVAQEQLGRQTGPLVGRGRCPGVSAVVVQECLTVLRHGRRQVRRN